MTIYEFSCMYYDPDLEKEGKKYHGVIYAESLTDAMSQIALYFGDEKIWDIHIDVTLSEKIYVFEDTSLKENMFEVRVENERQGNTM